MKIVIPGGSGQVGQILCRAFVDDGHELVVLSRTPNELEQRWRTVLWDGKACTDWEDEIDGADVVINLAGCSVNCRYNARHRQEILASRLWSTRAVGNAIDGALNPPRVWLQASTATIYEHRFDAPNDEQPGVIGGQEANAPDTWKFSIDVATQWEAMAREKMRSETRLVLMRSALTLSPDPGGIFDVLLNLVRKGLGGRAGDGKQYISWVHDVDFVRAVKWLIEHDELDGPVNLASPNPLPNAEFMRELRKAWGTKVGLPATKWMLEIGAILMRTETELILKSRRVVPTRLLKSGFEFTFPNWPHAASDLCRRWQETRKTTIR